MGAILSPARKLQKILRAPKMKLLNRGKVRDTYLLPDKKNLLLVCSDGISIFDIVLNFNVPMKGAILNLMSHFWFKLLEEQGFKTHFVATGAGIDKYLPEKLRGNADLQSRAMVVKKLDVREFEFIYRDKLTGSGYLDYLATGSVCGHKLPVGLKDGDQLPRPLFAPSTKADVGHDENVDAKGVGDKYPKESFLGYEIFTFAVQYARERGIAIADTKFEFGIDAEGNICICDEVLSPDSSRFWEFVLWVMSRKLEERSSPSSFDKEIARKVGKKLGINKLRNDDMGDLEQAWKWKGSKELIKALTDAYRYIFWRLTGETLENYAKKLGVALPPRRKNIVVLLGSESDLTTEVKQAIQAAGVRYTNNGELTNIRVVTNFSCHRQFKAMVTLARTGKLEVMEAGETEPRVLKLADVDYFIAGAGLAAQLPGMLDAALAAYGRSIPVIGLAFGPDHTENQDAARLSISHIPGQPVIMNEIDGTVYTNAEGLTDALKRIATGELPPAKARTVKPIHIDVPVS